MEIKVVNKTGDTMWHFPLTQFLLTMDNEEIDKLSKSYTKLIQNIAVDNFDCVKFVGKILEEYKASESEVSEK